MKKNSVDRCIVIADSWPVSDIGSTEECMSMFPSGNEDGVYVIGGISPLKDFDRQLEVIRKGIEDKALVGIKLYTGHEDFSITDERLDAVYDLAVKTKTPVLFHSGWDNRQYSDTEVAAEVAEKYPELRLICCHCWYPLIIQIQYMYKYRNMFFDMSSIADDPKRNGDLSGLAKQMICAALDRFIYGSDAFSCGMEQHLSFFKGMDLPENVSRKFFAENAMRIYKL